jgi:formate hydrogenlyase subunit 3/multisubunit Na+/H+ antiporter MnhD subunit
MNAPVLWILVPGAIAVLLFFIRWWERSTWAVGTIAAVGLAWLAGLFPIGDPFDVGPWTIKLNETLIVLGRRFVLSDGDRPVLVLLYLITALWFIFAYFVRPGNLFIPVALGMVALFTATLAVDPFLYAALFIEIIALLSIPLLARPGGVVRRGVLRFLTFQTLGAPFILFTGWMLAGVEASPGDVELVIRASILMGFGFAFLLAIFPFHSWIPMLAEDIHPFIAGFMFAMVPLVVSLFGLGFLNRYVWLRNAAMLATILRFIGALMVVVGGVWAAFQTHFGRIMGFAIVIEIGLSLLAISLVEGSGLEIFFSLILGRMISLLMWTSALALLRDQQGDLTFASLRGVGRRFPVLSIVLIVAHLAIVGFPLLFGFPVRLILWRELGTQNLLLGISSTLGSLGLAIAGFRSLEVVLAQDGEELPESGGSISPILRVFLIVAGLLLVLNGLFPQWISPFIEELAQVFPNLAP